MLNKPASLPMRISCSNASPTTAPCSGAMPNAFNAISPAHFDGLPVTSGSLPVAYATALIIGPVAGMKPFALGTLASRFVAIKSAPLQSVWQTVSRRFMLKSGSLPITTTCASAACSQSTSVTPTSCNASSKPAAPTAKTFLFGCKVLVTCAAMVAEVNTSSCVHGMPSPFNFSTTWARVR